MRSLVRSMLVGDQSRHAHGPRLKCRGVSWHGSRSVSFRACCRTALIRGCKEWDRRGGRTASNGWKGGIMVERFWCSVLVVAALAWTAMVEPAPAPRPEGTLTVAVATFGNERWLPELYPGAEDIVLKPMMQNLLSRDLKTGALTPMLAERWEVLEGGRAWRFYLRKSVQFHNGQGEMTAEDVKFTLEAIARDGSANSLGPEFRLIKSMDI